MQGLFTQHKYHKHSIFHPLLSLTFTFTLEKSSFWCVGWMMVGWSEQANTFVLPPDSNSLSTTGFVPRTTRFALPKDPEMCIKRINKMEITVYMNLKPLYTQVINHKLYYCFQLRLLKKHTMSLKPQFHA